MVYNEGHLRKFYKKLNLTKNMNLFIFTFFSISILFNIATGKPVAAENPSDVYIPG